MSFASVYVLVDDDIERRRQEIWLARHASPGVHLDLIGGPVVAERIIRSLSLPCGLGAGDAAALVDLSRRRLLFHLNPRLVVDERPAWAGVGALEFARVLRRILAAVWEGWRLSWSWRGDLDLACYLAGGDIGPPGAVASGGPTLAGASHPGHPKQPGVDPVLTTQTLVTVREGDRLRHWLTASPAVTVLRYGEAVAAIRPPGRADPRAWAAVSGTPGGGVHIDPGMRRVDWWTAGTTGGWDPVGLARERWGGDWQVTFCEDRYEEVAARCHPDLSVPRPDLARGLAALRRETASPGIMHSLGQDAWDLLQVAMAEMDSDIAVGSA